MPIIKSAIKRLRQTGKRELRNLARKNRLKAALKGFKKLVKDGNMPEAAKQLSSVYQVIDKSVKHNIIHSNNGARKKSWCANALAKAGK